MLFTLDILSPMHILSHRGLETSRPGFSESSYEAFKDQLERGFGIEFDVNFSADGMIIVHDSTLERITKGQDKRALRELTSQEAVQVRLENGRLATFDELMALIDNSPSKINALHLKGKFQGQKDLKSLLFHLVNFPQLFERMLIFDVKPQAAKYLRSKNPDLILVPSVAHPHDIRRYNSAVAGTLISIEDAIAHKQEGLYDWVWLDEWDRTDDGGKDKKFYTKETFDQLRSVRYKIALVTPELHATSLGLLGGEAHPDAANKEALFARIQEIIALSPVALCPDSPD